MNNQKLSRKEKNIQKVIQAGLESFIANGIENTKVSDIATSVGLTERSAFRYFKTKGDLVLACGLLFWQQTVNFVINSCDKNMPKNSNGLQQVYFILNQYTQLYFTSKNRVLFVAEAEVYLARCGKSLLINNKPPIRYEDANGPLANAIRKGIKDKSIKDDASIPLLYYNCYDSILGLMQKMAIEEGISDDDAHVRLILFCETLTNMFANKE